MQVKAQLQVDTSHRGTEEHIMGFSVLHLISLLLLWYFLLVPVMLINFSGFLSFVFSLLQSYIVYLGSHSHGPNPSASDLESATNSHYKLLGLHLGRYIYRIQINLLNLMDLFMGQMKLTTRIYNYFTTMRKPKKQYFIHAINTFGIWYKIQVIFELSKSG